MVVFVCFRWVQWGERESGSNDTYLLSCLFFFFALFLSLFPSFSLPAGLMPASSSSSSCCFVRAAVVCSSSLLGTYVVLLAAFLIFLHHIIQNSCRLFFAFLSFSALCRYFVPRLRVVSPVQQLSVPLQARNTYAVLAAFLILHQSSELLSAFFSSYFPYLSGLACFVMFYQVR